jgi:hypothetical protein
VRARRLQHVERADRVDVEVGERLLGRPVVRGLGRGVDDQADVAAQLGEERGQPVPVADVDLVVGVPVADLLGQAVQVPPGGAVLAEEVAAHVVVDADDVHAEAGEVPHRLGADQTGGSGHHDDIAHQTTSWREFGPRLPEVMLQSGHGWWAGRLEGHRGRPPAAVSSQSCMALM